MTTDAIRENLARALADEDATTHGKEPYADTSWAYLHADPRNRWLVRADRLLAGPLAPLLAKLQAVEALIEQAEDRVWASTPPITAAALIAEGNAPQVSTGDLHRALDGTP